jgi:tRNA A-37 threonylcarbamoyl transferase component Bud32
MMTNDLRNIDISQLLKNPNMKPKKNPIHQNFADSIQHVFEKFGFSKEDYYGKGGHNKIYQNDRFVLRITKLRLNPGSDSDFDKNLHLDVEEKYDDEKMFLQAVKRGLCPNIYFLGNIENNGHINRYMVMEKYDYTLCKFLSSNQSEKVLESSKYYESNDAIQKDICDQIIDILGKLTKMGIVYYDLTSRNIVLRQNKHGRIEVKFVDWDCDLCREESWLDPNEKILRESVVYLYLMLLDFFLLSYIKQRIFKEEMFSRITTDILDKVRELLLDYNKNEYGFLFIHYFHNIMFISKDDALNFNKKDGAYKNKLITKCYHQVVDRLWE